MQVQNTSNQDSQNTVFELDLLNAQKSSTFPFNLPSDQTAKQSIGLLKAGQTALVKYTVLVDPSASNGNYTIQLGIGSNSIVSKKVPYSISIVSRKPQVELIQSGSSQAKPGELISPQVTVKNIGGSKAYNVLISVPESRTVTATGQVIEREIKQVGTAVYVPSIELDQELQVTIPLAIDSSAELKTYTIPVHIEFQDNERNSYSIDRTIGLKVSSEPQLDAALAAISPLASPGNTSEFSFQLFNIGRSTASNTVVEISSTAFSELSESKVFIGTLQSDDFDSFKVKAKILPNQPIGAVPVKLTITFKDPDGKQFILEKIVEAKIVTAGEAKQDGGGSDNTLLYAAIALIAIGAGYWWFRKRKQNIKSGKSS